MQDLLSELIAISSESGEEADMQAFITEWMAEHGVRVIPQGTNAVGFIEGANRKQCLVLSGHMDTVSAGNELLWNTLPTRAEPVGDKLYGLGSSDMKSGVTVLLELASYYAEHKPPCDLWFVFVTNEEVDGSGTQSFVQWFTKQPDYKRYERAEAIITEPSAASLVEVGHRGNYFISLDVQSTSGHASRPDTIKHHAIHVASGMIQDLSDLQKQWATKYKHKQLGLPTIAITGIHAGDMEAPNKIAGNAVVQLDIRTTPELHPNIKAEIQALCSRQPCPVNIEIISDSPAGWTNESAHIRQLFQRLFPTFRQLPMKGSSDLCFFSAAGIPCVIYGPGEKSVIHGPNEYVVIQDLAVAYDTLKKVVDDYEA